MYKIVFRNALNHQFDYVFYLMEDQNTANLKLEDFAKIYSLLALKTFEKNHSLNVHAANIKMKI